MKRKSKFKTGYSERLVLLLIFSTAIAGSYKASLGYTWNVKEPFFNKYVYSSCPKEVEPDSELDCIFPNDYRK